MEIKRTIIFNKLRISNDLTCEALCQELNKKRYNDKTGIGVISALQDEDVVHVDILIRIPTYINNYDQQSKSLTKDVVNVYDEVSIDFDFSNYLAYSFSALSKFNKAKAFVRNTFQGKIAFENILLTNEKIRGGLDKKEYSHRILSMTIRKFIYADGAIGRFSAIISSQDIGERLLKEYKDDVRNVVLCVEPDSISSFILQYGMQNSISLKCEEADFWSIVEFIKTNL